MAKEETEEPEKTLYLEENKCLTDKTKEKLPTMLFTNRFIRHIGIHAKMSISQQLSHETKMVDQKHSILMEKLIPKEYHEFLSVFNEEELKQFLEPKPWDHTINLTPEFIPKDCKVYPMDQRQEKLMNEFIDKHLAKGYIQPSKSLMASPFFFITKKDSDKL